LRKKESVSIEEIKNHLELLVYDNDVVRNLVMSLYKIAKRLREENIKMKKILKD
jgi:hypothetical protein